MLSPAIRLEPNVPDFQFCLAMCAGTQDATYATWSHLDHTCTCYSSGERLCRRQAVQFGFSQDDIDQCIAEPGAAEGILVIGGESSPSAVEFWSSTNADQESCQLSDYPRKMWDGPTMSLVGNQLVACLDKSCDIYQEGAWEHLQDTIEWRRYHSAVGLREKLLLIGGYDSRSTEFIPVDGSGASPGPFTVRHGRDHCTMKISEDVIVVTGGRGTPDRVTEYQLTDGRETALTRLTEGRGYHACGVYQDADGQQVSEEVLLVTGGSYSNFLSSTEIATYTSSSTLSWRIVETGDLPWGRFGLRAAVVENVLYVTGGYDGSNPLTSILSWDPLQEKWTHAGDLKVARYYHAVVAIPSNAIECVACLE